MRLTHALLCLDRFALRSVVEHLLKGATALLDVIDALSKALDRLAPSENVRQVKRVLPTFQISDIPLQRLAQDPERAHDLGMSVSRIKEFRFGVTPQGVRILVTLNHAHRQAPGFFRNERPLFDRQVAFRARVRTHRVWSEASKPQRRVERR